MALLALGCAIEAVLERYFGLVANDILDARRFCPIARSQPLYCAGMASVPAKRRIAAREPTGPDWRD